MTNLELCKQHYIDILVRKFGLHKMAWLSRELQKLEIETLIFLLEQWGELCSDTTQNMSAAKAEQTAN